MIRPSFQSGYAHNAGESAYPNLWDKLEGAWEFSLGPQGPGVYDFSGFNRHGTVTGGFGTDLTWEIGKHGWAMKSAANANTSRISASISTGTVWSWEGRIRLTSSTDSWEVLFTQGGGNGIWLRSSGIIWFEYGAGNTLSNATLTPGVDYHLVIVVDGTNVSIWIDGILDKSEADAPASIALDSMFNNTGSETFDGICYYQRIWKRALTYGEIRELYAGASPFTLADDSIGFVAGGGSTIDFSALGAHGSMSLLLMDAIGDMFPIAASASAGLSVLFATGDMGVLGASASSQLGVLTAAAGDFAALGLSASASLCSMDGVGNMSAISAPASAQLGFVLDANALSGAVHGSRILIQEEGAYIGRPYVINFVGSIVTVTMVGGRKANVTIVLPASPSFSNITLAEDGAITMGSAGSINNTGGLMYVNGTISFEGGIQVAGDDGASGTFTTVDGKTVTVSNGIITDIV